MTARDTLVAAQRLLEGDKTGGSWARAAALLLRQALEEALYEKLHTIHGIGRDATFTTKLILLREATNESMADEVAYTWSALSSATHIHGYGLPPTTQELKRWGETVARFVG